ncbi:hypothetical protein FWI75_07575 [Francisella tularensis subsp. holarctica]|nr:hypothetical protein [Francisella tularensis subsp. holarctica]
MMAFLLDIITFLQISFSTNIFFYKYLFLQISFGLTIVSFTQIPLEAMMQ